MSQFNLPFEASPLEQTPVKMEAPEDDGCEDGSRGQASPVGDNASPWPAGLASPTGAVIGADGDCGFLDELETRMSAFKIGKREPDDRAEEPDDASARSDDESTDGEGPRRRAVRFRADEGPQKRTTRQATPYAIRVLKATEMRAATELHEASEARAHEASEARACEAAKRGALVLWARDCFDHDTGESHQENARRLDVLVGPDRGVLRNLAEVDVEECAAKAALADVLRVHDHDYVAHLQASCAAAARTAGGELPGGPYAAAGHLAQASHKGGRRMHLDSDTRLSPASFDAALSAAGAACAAVDRVTRKDARRRACFVAGRPPGHHAGPRGAVAHPNFWKSPDMCSCGFCLLNTAAIAAAYARCRYGRTPEDDDTHVSVRRVAIVDFDIHHGNGTQACLDLLRPKLCQTPLPPSWPPHFYTAFKPWLDEADADETFFASTHLYDGTFYPADGDASRNDDNTVNITLTPLGGDSVGSQSKRDKLTEKQRCDFRARASRELRSKVTAQLLPKLRAFAPDLLIISAGFDGHEHDLYHFLTNEDYSWLTTALQEACAETAKGRCVSLLEGGYSVERRPRGDAAPVQRTRGQSKTTAHGAVVITGPAYDEGGLAQAALAHVGALASFEC
ncbi:hypothetical protein M885DRAFT_472444 [Pelagophyceae sp. CCMP2097]|nr:hypothetical protein M885DRAFT_472444 [Pelagophyceae sp. CCMP2097]